MAISSESLESHFSIYGRRNEIQTFSNKNVDDIFAQWPVLKHPSAYTLIEEDFRFLKLTSEDCINNWFNFFSKVQEVCPIKEDKTVSTLRLLLDADDLSDDAKVVIGSALVFSFHSSKRENSH